MGQLQFIIKCYMLLRPPHVVYPNVQSCLIRIWIFLQWGTIRRLNISVYLQPVTFYSVNSLILRRRKKKNRFFFSTSFLMRMHNERKLDEVWFSTVVMYEITNEKRCQIKLEDNLDQTLALQCLATTFDVV